MPAEAACGRHHIVDGDPVHRVVLRQVCRVFLLVPGKRCLEGVDEALGAAGRADVLLRVSDDNGDDVGNLAVCEVFSCTSLLPAVLGIGISEPHGELLDCLGASGGLAEDGYRDCGHREADEYYWQRVIAVAPLTSPSSVPLAMLAQPVITILEVSSPRLMRASAT
jgi:hypothetical protein